MNPIILAIVVLAVMVLIAAFISNVIKYESGANPKDAGKRKIVFWVVGILVPAIIYVLGAFVLAPAADDDPIIYGEFITQLSIATAVGFVLYIIIGFAMSKMFKTKKIGNWF